MILNIYKLTVATFFSILLLLTCSSALAKTYGLLLSGGYSAEHNHYTYYNNVKKIHKALRVRGVKRDDIFTLYADGGKKGADAVKVGRFSFLTSTVDTPNSFEEDGYDDIKRGASKEELEQTFDLLSTKMKKGDNLLLFITSYGSKKHDGVTLWDEKHYKFSDFQKQIDKLPHGATIQVITSVAYGGRLLQLTSPDTCVVANSDAKSPTRSDGGFKSAFIHGFADSLTDNIGDSDKNGKTSFQEAFSYASKQDKLNGPHVSSMGGFLWSHEKENLEELKLDKELLAINSSYNVSPREKLINEINMALKNINSSKSKKNASTYLKIEERVNKLKNDLDSIEILNVEKQIDNEFSNLEEVKEKYKDLPEEEKKPYKLEYNEVFTKVLATMERQNKFVNDVKEHYAFTLREMRFLKYSYQKDIEEYLGIRKCLNYEI